MRLIDADKLNARLSQNGTPYFTVCDIDNAPTVDAVVVVRCKDCIYHREINQSEKEYYNEGALICAGSYLINTVVDSNDFCFYGKEEVNDG